MNNYKKINNIIGWVIFIIAAFVYISTIEPTASFWDCSEFIAAAFKMQVPHPPGSPLFLMIAHLFTLFAPNVKDVAASINIEAATCSGLTIMFLFWTITRLAGKFISKDSDKPEMSNWKTWAVLGSGIVGALAFMFSDSFWFSAVEGEVYAMSSLFTAIVFWAILKWEASVNNDKYSLRWLVLICYLMGLSIGVHLLSLLTIPALVFIFYFKKYKTTRKGIIYAAIISIAILGFVQYGIIQYFVKIGAYFDLLFVNSFGMPFNSGLIIYALIVMGLLIWGIIYTHRKNNMIWNTALICLTVIIWGYSSYATVVIRSSANPSLDENNPEDAFSLLSYLNRSQYGSVPLLYGQYFNSPLDPRNPYSNGDPVYETNQKTGKYDVVDDRKNSIPNYDSRFCTVFPRMWSAQQNHINQYKNWTNFTGTPIRYTDGQGQTKVINKPTFGENLEFFFRYQCGWMYWRYFMWNFSGRQNDMQGFGPVSGEKGNWITGIPFIDHALVGNQSKLSKSQLDNKGRNVYYLLPFILGIIGLIYQFKHDQKNGYIVLMLWFFTGIAIVLYLNNYPMQPRERDYAYVGSFYAFAIWIGLGVFALADYLSKYVKGKSAAIITTVVCFLAVPTLMGAQNWNDHDRSGRYSCRDFAKDYLASCAPNAILFTDGDNDTFPLWYIQEVEGYRTDVKVVNLSLLNTDWYIDHMRRKYYNGLPVPFDLPKSKYVNGTNNIVPIVSRTKKYVDVDDIMKFIESDNQQSKVKMASGNFVDYIPTKNLSVKVDKKAILDNPKWTTEGYISKSDSNELVNDLKWTINKRYIYKADLMILDLLSANNWKRPIYFAITTGSDAYIGLQKYFQLEGLTYHLIPIETDDKGGRIGRVNTKVMYDNMMHKFAYGGFDNPKVYANQDNRRMIMNFRSDFARLANALIDKGKKAKAKKVLDKCMKVFPEYTVPYDYFSLTIARGYYRLGDTAQADKIISALASSFNNSLTYFNSLKSNHAVAVSNQKRRTLAVMRQVMMITNQFHKKDAFAKKMNQEYGYINQMIQQMQQQQ